LIPPTLHFVWLNPPIPDIYVRLLARAVEKNRSWLKEVHLWSDANKPPILHAAEYDRVQGGHAFRSDIIRYEVMARYGGVYCDWDMIWIDDLTNWIGLDGDNFFVRDHTQSPHVVNAVFGLSRTNPIGWAMVERLRKSCVDYAGYSQSERSGVGYFTRVIKSFPERAVVLPTQAFSGYAPSDYKHLRVIAAAGKPPPCIAMHFWASNKTLPMIESHVAQGNVQLPTLAQSMVILGDFVRRDHSSGLLSHIQA